MGSPSQADATRDLQGEIVLRILAMLRCLTSHTKISLAQYCEVGSTLGTKTPFVQAVNPLQKL